MNFNKHYNLVGKHAFLSASKHSWINYDDDKLINSYNNYQNVERGTRLHALAAELIDLKIKQRASKQTFNMHVNDAIGFKMDPEVVLYYSDNCFGTADAISFRNNKLRIHDLKTGFSPTSMDQLKIYAALFCLEYSYHPTEIEMELRIYQNDEVVVEIPDPNDIKIIMDKIIAFDRLIEGIKNGAM